MFTRTFIESINQEEYNPDFIYLEPSNNDIIENIKLFSNKHKEIVIKMDGLAGGKGVFVQGDHFNTFEEGINIIQNKICENSLLIEEKIIGEEFSLFTLSDGEHFVHLPPVQDYKRAYNNNKGPNTGGMGAYSPAPIITKRLEKHNIKLEIKDGQES